MKRNHWIENIQQEINSRITAHTASDRDFIVFRPKTFLNSPNSPIISKKINPMTSIFQLEGKQKNKKLLRNLRCKTNQIQEKSFEVDDHLQIQKCKTFKKFKLGKEIFSTTLESFNFQTAQKLRKKRESQTTQVRKSLKKTAQIGRQRKYMNPCLGGIQKKKSIEPILFNENINNFGCDQKEFFSSSININRLRPSQVHHEIPEIFVPRFFHEATVQKNSLRGRPQHPSNSHKRLQTELPANNFSRLSYEKPKKKLEMLKNSISGQFDKLSSSRDEANWFNPWQTVEIFERQEFQQTQNCS